MFSKGSARSISLATETPSLVTCGVPKDFWRMTFRPPGPSVIRTVLASLLMPTRTFARASSSNMICLAMCAFFGWCVRVRSVGRVRFSEVHAAAAHLVQALHAALRRSALLLGLGLGGDQRIGGEQELGHADRVLQRGLGDLGRVDDARGEHVDVLAGQAVE